MCDTKLVRCETKCAESNIKEASARKQNFELLGREDEDLVARETCCHESCRKELLRCPERNTGQHYTQKKKAHNETFLHIRNHIEDSVILKAQVERLQMVRE